jgi:hypothetical protein
MKKSIFVLIHGVEGMQEGYSDTDFTYYESYGEALIEQQTHVSSYLDHGYIVDEDSCSRFILVNAKHGLSVVVGIYRIDDYVEGTAFNWLTYGQLDNLPTDCKIDKENSIYAVDCTLYDRHVMNEVYEIRSNYPRDFDEMNDLEEIANFIATTQGFMVDVDGYITHFSPIKNIIS